MDYVSWFLLKFCNFLINGLNQISVRIKLFLKNLASSWPVLLLLICLMNQIIAKTFVVLLQTWNKKNDSLISLFPSFPKVYNPDPEHFFRDRDRDYKNTGIFRDRDPVRSLFQSSTSRGSEKIMDGKNCFNKYCIFRILEIKLFIFLDDKIKLFISPKKNYFHHN